MTRGRSSRLGDTKVSPNGYHYTRTVHGWELTGRLKAGEERGYPLKPNERVKYKDGNKLNNDPSNLIVYVVKESSRNKKRARLQAKLDDVKAQLEELEAEETS